MWEEVAPVDQNGIITMYEVLYVPLETFGGAIQSQMIDIPVTDMSVLLMDLEDYVDYFISIRAFTSVGEGPYSQGMIIRTQENSKIMIYTQTEQKKNMHIYRVYSSRWFPRQCNWNGRFFHHNYSDLGQCPSHRPEWDHHYV